MVMEAWSAVLPRLEGSTSVEVIAERCLVAEGDWKAPRLKGADYLDV